MMMVSHEMEMMRNKMTWDRMTYIAWFGKPITNRRPPKPTTNHKRQRAPKQTTQDTNATNKQNPPVPWGQVYEKFASPYGLGM